VAPGPRLFASSVLLAALGVALQGCGSSRERQLQELVPTTASTTPVHVKIVETEFLDGEDLASVVTAAYGEDLKQPFESFHVVLDHGADDSEGMYFTTEFNSLYIKALDASGSIGGWNAIHPDKAVVVGDRVVDVNGVHGHSGHLEIAIQLLARLDITILRVPIGGALSPPDASEFYVIMLDRSQGQSFGVSCSMSEQSLLIKGISEGLVGEWNLGEKGSANVVMPGDRIIQVNRAQGSAEALLKECNKREILEIRLLRGEGPVEVNDVEEDLDGKGGGEIAYKEITMTKTTTSSTVTTSTATTTTATTTTATTATATTATATTTATTTSSSFTGTSSTRSSTTTQPPTTTTSTTKTTTTVTATTKPPTTTTYTIRTTTVIKEHFVRGLKAEFFYHIDQGIEFHPVSKEKLETIFKRKPDLVRIDAQVYYPLSLDGWGGVEERFYFAARWSGEIQIVKAGIYTFNLRSDDGSVLELDGTALIGKHSHPSWDEHVWLDQAEHWRYLESGEHSLKVLYFNSVLHAGVILQYMGPDTEGRWMTVPANVLQCNTSDLPDSVTRGSAFLRKFTPNDGARVEGASSTRSVVAWLAASVAGLAVLGGVGVWGAKSCSRHFRPQRRYSELRRILAEPEGTGRRAAPSSAAVAMLDEDEDVN